MKVFVLILKEFWILFNNVSASIELILWLFFLKSVNVVNHTDRFSDIEQLLYT